MFDETVPATVRLVQVERLAFHVSRRISKLVSLDDASAHVTSAEPSALLVAETLAGAAGGAGAGAGTSGVVTASVLEKADPPTLLNARTR